MVSNAAAATACSSAYSAVGGAPTVNVLVHGGDAEVADVVQAALGGVGQQ